MKLNNSKILNELYQFNYKDINLHAVDINMTSILNSLESWDDYFYYNNHIYILDMYTTGKTYKVNLETKEVIQLSFTFDMNIIENGYYDWMDILCGNHILLLESPDNESYIPHILTLDEDIIDTPINIISDKGYGMYDVYPEFMFTDVNNSDIIYCSTIPDPSNVFNDIIYKIDVKNGTMESMNINISEASKNISGEFIGAYISNGKIKVIFRTDKYFIFYEYSEILNKFYEIDRIIATYTVFNFIKYTDNHIIINYKLNEYFGILIYDIHTHEKYLTPRMINNIQEVYFPSSNILANVSDDSLYYLEKIDKQDLSEYITKEELDKKADKSEIPNIEGLASEEYVDNMFYSALGGLKFVKITQESYDALTNKDPNTVYIIVSAENMNNSTGEEGN